MISGGRGKLFAVCLAMLMVPGCGGEGSSTSTSTPTPTPSPSPSPTPSSSPTGTPAPGTSYPPGCVGADAVTAPGFPLALTGMRYAFTGTAPVFFDPQSSGVLRKQGDRYTFFAQDNLIDSKIDESTSFGSTEISSSLSTSEMIAYKRECSSPTIDPTQYSHTLLLSRPGSSNPLINLNYAGYGSFTYVRSNKTDADTDFRPFGYVLSNPASGNTQSGTLIYRGRLIGDAKETTLLATKHYSITGTVEVTVDFTAKTFTATLDLTGQRDLNNGGGSFAFGQISYTQANADFTQLNGTRNRGKLFGMFAGPAAEEMALAANLTMPNPDDPNGGDVNIAIGGAAKR